VAEWGSPRVAILAAVFYTAAPFHLAEMYRFFLYAEFAATAFLPFCLLYLTRICRERGFANTVLFAVSFSLLILTHLPLTIIATLCFFIYALLVVDVRLWRITAFQVLTAGILASLLTSFYWIRVVIELDWVSHAQSIYWLSLSDGNLILFPFSLNGLDLPGYLQNLYRHFDVMVILTSTLLMPFLVLLAKERSSLTPPAGRVLIALSLTTVFCLLMLARPSEFLWLNLSFLQRLQFPWRWLSVASVFAGAAFSVSFAFLVKGGYLRSRAAVIACLSLMLIVIAYDIRVISAAPGRFQQEEFNSVVSDFQSEPASEFWWPIWAKSGAFGNTMPVSAGERSVEISIWEPTRRKFIVHEGIPVELRIATFYYPYWHAAVDGVELTIAMDQNGVISLPVRYQRSEIILWFEEPVIYFFAKWTSAVAWLLIGGFQCLRLVEFVRRRYRR
nr:hypothetical protein [Pyrinomonadaceae bacterium]